MQKIHRANVRFSVVCDGIHCAQYRDLEDAEAHAAGVEAGVDGLLGRRDVVILAVTVNGLPVEPLDNDEWAVAS